MIELRVTAEARADIEFLGRERRVTLKLGKEEVTMPLDVAHSLAAGIESACKLIEDDSPFSVVFQ